MTQINTHYLSSHVQTHKKIRGLYTYSAVRHASISLFRWENIVFT